jgi:hypothetical protein
MMRMPESVGAGHPFTYDDIVAGPIYLHLTNAVQDCIDVGVFAPGTDPSMVATTLWAATHGAVSLCLAKPSLARDDALAMCDQVITQAGLGAALASYVEGRLPERSDDGDASHWLAALLAKLAPP